MAERDINRKIAAAELNLQRKLDWIGRYDMRIAFVAGVAITMLGVLANTAGMVNCWEWYSYLAFAIAVIMLFMSLFFVLKSQYPKTLSPNTSLLFFGTISCMSFMEFRAKFTSATEEEYLEDLLHQVHVNSVILKQKFINLKLALMLTLAAVIPWVLVIYFSKIYIK